MGRPGINFKLRLHRCLSKFEECLSVVSRTLSATPSRIWDPHSTHSPNRSQCSEPLLAVFHSCCHAGPMVLVILIVGGSVVAVLIATCIIGYVVKHLLSRKKDRRRIDRSTPRVPMARRQEVIGTVKTMKYSPSSYFLHLCFTDKFVTTWSFLSGMHSCGTLCPKILLNRACESNNNATTLHHRFKYINIYE